jgi:hypothetical protein
MNYFPQLYTIIKQFYVFFQSLYDNRPKNFLPMLFLGTLAGLQIAKTSFVINVR